MTSVKQYVGLDVHKDSIAIAVAPGGPGLEVHDRGVIPHDVTRLLNRIKAWGRPEDLFVAYEAGPTGYGLYHALSEAGISCIVVAPSKTPIRPGERVKTDKRDARKLARYLRSGELVAVSPPGKELEALRDAVRARDDAVRAQRSARQNLSGFLLRHGRVWPERTKWTGKYLDWVRTQRFDCEPQRQVLEDYYQEVLRLTKRVAAWDEDIARYAEQCQEALPYYRAFQALKGVASIVSATLIAEIHDFKRFESASRLMSYVGLTPSEYSSGNRTRRGAITKAGNPHVRWKLIQAAWKYVRRPALTRSLAKRQEGLPEPVCDIAWEAQKRLHRKYTTMIGRGKSKQVAITAVARELAGFIWSIAQEVSPRQA